MVGAEYAVVSVFSINRAQALNTSLPGYLPRHVDRCQCPIASEATEVRPLSNAGGADGAVCELCHPWEWDIARNCTARYAGLDTWWVYKSLIVVRDESPVPLNDDLQSFLNRCVVLRYTGQ